MKTNVALIGFMGTGKTTVGKILAQKLDKVFIELDVLIEQKAGKSIADIFRDYGEIRFREYEIEVVKEIAATKNAVIACGGGIVLNTINIFRLKQECVIVCLTAPIQEILNRTSRDKETRPLLAVKNKQKQIKELLEYRRPYYERAADIFIDTDGIDTAGVVQKIVDALKTWK